MTAINPMRGEAAIGEHRIVVDFNGWCALEAETGLKVPQLLQLMQDGLGFSDMRQWIRVFLVEPMDDPDVGELIGSLGYETALKCLSAALDCFFAPPPKEKKANPRKAA